MKNSSYYLLIAPAACLLVLLTGCGVSEETIDAKNAATFEASINKIGLSLTEEDRIRFAQDVYVLYTSARTEDIPSIKQLYTEDHEALYANGFRGWERGGYSDLVQKIGEDIDAMSAEEVHKLATEIRSNAYAAMAKEMRVVSDAIPKRIVEKKENKSNFKQRLKVVEQKRKPFLDGMEVSLSDVKVESLEFVPAGARGEDTVIAGTATVVNPTDVLPGIEPVSICGVSVDVYTPRGKEQNSVIISFSELKPGERRTNESFQFRKQWKVKATSSTEISLKSKGTYRTCDRRPVFGFPPNQSHWDKRNLEQSIAGCDQAITDLAQYEEDLIEVLEMLEMLSRKPKPLDASIRVPEPSSARVCTVRR